LLSEEEEKQKESIWDSGVLASEQLGHRINMNNMSQGEELNMNQSQATQYIAELEHNSQIIVNDLLNEVEK